MNWTTEQPKEPGFYWFRWQSNDLTHTRLVKLVEYGWFEWHGMSHKWPAKTMPTGEYWGPIPAPEELAGKYLGCEPFE